MVGFILRIRKDGFRKLWLPAIIMLSVNTHIQDDRLNIYTENIPKIPVASDSYQMWDQWPTQRIGVRAYMRSTYDRTGGNVDESNFLFANKEEYNFTLDVKGKGVLYFFRANHWHGSPWHFIVDDIDQTVQETATDDPVSAWRQVVDENDYVNEPETKETPGNKKVILKSDITPLSSFPEPLNWTWTTTKGADLIWTPIPFKESLRIAYSRTRYGTGYYIYHLFANEENLSLPLRSWDIKQNPDEDVLNLIGLAGTDVAPKQIKKRTGRILLNKERVVLCQINAPPSSIRALKLTLPLDKALELERLRLLVTWDGTMHASINAPLSLFFGAGTLYNRENVEYLVKGFPINIRYDYVNNKIELACYYPMPFFKSAKFELAGIKPGDIEINYEIRYESLISAPHFNSYFHATYKDIPLPEPGKDMVFLDTKNIEGQKEWSGSFVGTSIIFSHDGYMATLEGDPRFFFDDSQTPQAQGTGTEEWCGGGDYWGGRNMTLPFAGHPCGAPGKKKAKNEKDLIESAYRFLLADLMPFGCRAIIRFEHGANNLVMQHYEAVTYWYGLPAPSLIKTDELDIGDLLSEKDHQYNSPGASEVQFVSSRYEWGIDSFPQINRNILPELKELEGTEVYPQHEENGRIANGISEFTVSLSPENVGVMLRRTLDYSFPNQTSEVFVEEKISAQKSQWKKVGTWYLAGSNTFVHSDPKGEMDKRILEVRTSNRRFRQDEFLIPAGLTKGKNSIKVRIKFVHNDQELSPGFPFPEESAWSELKYDVFCYVVPLFSIKK